jgi:hypothetical protein
LNKVDFPTLGKPTIPHFKLMAVPENQAGKCMRCIVRRSWAACRGTFALLLLAGACATASPAEDPFHPSPALLGDARAEIDAKELGVAAGYDLRLQSKRQSAVTTCPTRKVCSAPCSTTAFMPKVTAPCMRSFLR